MVTVSYRCSCLSVIDVGIINTYNIIITDFIFNDIIMVLKITLMLRYIALTIFMIVIFIFDFDYFCYHHYLMMQVSLMGGTLECSADKTDEACFWFTIPSTFIASKPHPPSPSQDSSRRQSLLLQEDDHSPSKPFQEVSPLSQSKATGRDLQMQKEPSKVSIYFIWSTLWIWYACTAIWLWW